MNGLQSMVYVPLKDLFDPAEKPNLINGNSEPARNLQTNLRQ